MSELQKHPVDVETTESGVPFINAAGVSREAALGAISKIERELSNWVESSRGAPSLYDRVAYVAPDNPYALMKTAKSAVDNDDIIGGVADVTEGLMLQGIKWEAADPGDADIFNQMSGRLNLDAFVRQWHREEFTYSQVVVGVWWGTETFRSRTKSKAGRRSKKSTTIACPKALTMLDPQKVVPLRPGPFGQDRLAWAATRDETTKWDEGIRDAVMQEFLIGRYHPTRSERTELSAFGVDTENLMELNPERVFRHSRTRMPYEAWVVPRLKSTFPLLDLKQQLMESDRVSLVGAANYLLLVKQGSDEKPAQQDEIDNLKENFAVVAKLPVIIGDHRLSIEIITPDQEYVLSSAKWDTLDKRLIARALGALTVASSGQRNESTLTVARGVGRLLENRRHMMKRALEQHIARAVIDHPSNVDKFEGEPNLTFTPRNVQLDSDSQIVQAVLALRTQNELSRESTLEFLGYDQAVEAQRRQFEEENYDSTFKTRIPFAAQGGNGEADAESPQVSGGRGGRPAGGGQSKQSPQAQTKPKSGNGNPKTGA